MGRPPVGGSGLSPQWAAGPTPVRSIPAARLNGQGGGEPCRPSACDANNVTHILGIRAFGSQLLCEQLVGRGRRRINYQPQWDEEEKKLLLRPEYVDVYGIPLSVIPYKVTGERKRSGKGGKEKAEKGSGFNTQIVKNLRIET